MKSKRLNWQTPQIYDLDLMGHGDCRTGSSANPGRCASGESTDYPCQTGQGFRPHDCAVGGRAGGCTAGGTPTGNVCQAGSTN